MSINIPLNIVIGNTVESAMFALLTNANFIYNAKNSYHNFEKHFNILYKQEEFEILLRMLFLDQKVLCGFLVDNIIVDVDKRGLSIKIKHYNVDRQIYKFNKLVVFDDENIIGLENSSVKRTYKVIDYFCAKPNKLLSFVVEDVLLKTGLPFPQYVFMINNKARQHDKFNKKFVHDVCISFLKEEQLRDSSFDIKFNKIYIQNLLSFIKDYYEQNDIDYFKNDKLIINFKNREIFNIMPEFDNLDNVKFIANQEQLNIIRKQFYESLLKMDGYEKLNLLWTANIKLKRFREELRLNDEKHRLVCPEPN